MLTWGRTVSGENIYNLYKPYITIYNHIYYIINQVWSKSSYWLCAFRITFSCMGKPFIWPSRCSTSTWLAGRCRWPNSSWLASRLYLLLPNSTNAFRQQYVPLFIRPVIIFMVVVDQRGGVQGLTPFKAFFFLSFFFFFFLPFSYFLFVEYSRIACPCSVTQFSGRCTLILCFYLTMGDLRNYRSNWVLLVTVQSFLILISLTLCWVWRKMPTRKANWSQQSGCYWQLYTLRSTSPRVKFYWTGTWRRCKLIWTVTQLRRWALT